MRRFRFTYKLIGEFKGFNRNILIEMDKSTGDIGLDAHAALQTFISAVGNLKKYDIIQIQEIDENDLPIGEPIKPMGDNHIVPIKKENK